MRRNGSYNQINIDQFFMEDTVFEQVVKEAIASIKGITGLYQSRLSFLGGPVRLSRSKNKIKIKVYLSGEFGENLKEAGSQARDRIGEALRKLGGIEVERVDVIFKSVSSKVKG